MLTHAGTRVRRLHLPPVPLARSSRPWENHDGEGELGRAGVDGGDRGDVLYIRKTRSRAQNGDRLQRRAQVFQGHLGPTYVYLNYLGTVRESQERAQDANLVRAGNSNVGSQ